MPSAHGLRIGTAEARPGELTYGNVDVLEHPNGIPERLPVLIAQGPEDGPTLWLTANIHEQEGNGGTSVSTHKRLTGLRHKWSGIGIVLPSCIAAC